MSDLINRQAVLESLKTDYSLIMFDSYGNLTFAGERIIEAIKRVPSVESERKTGKWIPIRTKSPQNGQRIFISTIKGTIHNVIWNTDCIYNYARNGCWYNNWFVVAWMPFTLKPYKMEVDV